MNRYLKKRAPRLSDYPKIPAAKKARHEVVKPISADDRLATLNGDISRIEQEIQKQAARFEAIRTEMMTGIMSHDSVTARGASDQLMEILTKLHQERERVMAEADKCAIEKATGGPHEPTPPSQADCCKNGCDLRAGSDCIDVCIRCHKTYDHRIDNRVNNTVFEDFHPGEGVSRVGGYKPPNHFAEIVSQFQGKRRAFAPAEVVEKIRVLCERYHIPTHKITPDVVRMFLKQLQQEQATLRKYSKKTAPETYKKFTDYYKHCPEIAHRLSGIPPPWMMPMQEDRVTALFIQVVQGYKTSPRYLMRKKDRRNRKTREEPNNMNYLYVFYKLCQLLGYDCFLPYIPLPKSLNNIDDNDENGWKHICSLYGWAFCPTR